MSNAGAFNRRAAFQRRGVVSDGYGNERGEWAALLTAWGALSEKPGREGVRAGRPEAVAMGELRIRDSAAARGVTAADRVLIDGAAYAIRDIRPAQRTGVIEMVVERGAE